MKSELLVAHEKLGQFPLLRVYVVLCRVRNSFYQLLKPHHSVVYAL
jgi:hypothetical protein